MLATTGTSLPNLSKSSRFRFTPTRPAIANKCTTAFVEPPIAESTFIAFSNAFLFKTLESLRSSFTICTMRRPVKCDIVNLRESTAGIAATPGNCTPSASVTHAIVEAVPIVMQLPCDLALQDSIAINSSKLISPVLTFSL